MLPKLGRAETYNELMVLPELINPKTSLLNVLEFNARHDLFHSKHFNSITFSSNIISFTGLW
jgi:hypothetical protein